MPLNHNPSINNTDLERTAHFYIEALLSPHHVGYEGAEEVFGGGWYEVKRVDCSLAQEDLIRETVG